MITIYDATLREGAQGAGASFMMEDKLRIVHLLDELGVHYIEGGNPGSNPKDAAFYQRMRSEHVGAKLCAFGATARIGQRPEQDENIQALLRAETPVVTIFGKCWDYHVTQVLRAQPEQNLETIAETVRYLTEHGREVCFDAEHFFDGAKNSSAYALSALTYARQAGAAWLCLCDTNGGCFPQEIEHYTAEAVNAYGDCVGIHPHNDCGMAEANAIAAIQAGAAMAQVTANGLSERCGMADLFTTVPNLQLKLNYDCLPAQSLPKLHGASKVFYDLLGEMPNPGKPYVGANAFAHKAGMHIDGVLKHPDTFEHVPPESIGNQRRFALSEIAGRSAVLERIHRILPDIAKDSPQVAQVVERLKRMEFEGYQFDGADASFELEVRRMLKPFPALFNLRNFKVVVTEPAPADAIATAMVEISVGRETEITAANGVGPVNALDAAARKALERFYPSLADTVLTDYRVRVLEGGDGTAARVRVLIESRDNAARWTTIGVSGDVIAASWMALMDSLEYKLLKDEEERG